jgi:DNA-directed RNA polymerase specialized sigma24 family protein
MIEHLLGHVAGLQRHLALTGSRFEAEDLVQGTHSRVIAASGSVLPNAAIRVPERCF